MRTLLDSVNLLPIVDGRPCIYTQAVHNRLRECSTAPARDDDLHWLAAGIMPSVFELRQWFAYMSVSTVVVYFRMGCLGGWGIKPILTYSRFGFVCCKQDNLWQVRA